MEMSYSCTNTAFGGHMRRYLGISWYSLLSMEISLMHSSALIDFFFNSLSVLLIEWWRNCVLKWSSLKWNKGCKNPGKSEKFLSWSNFFRKESDGRCFQSATKTMKVSAVWKGLLPKDRCYCAIYSIGVCRHAKQTKVIIIGLIVHLKENQQHFPL